MTKVDLQGTITIKPLGKNSESVGSNVWRKGDKTIIPPALHSAMLAYADGKLDLNALGKVFHDYWRIAEALYNLEKGDEDAVVRFLRLILKLKYRAKSTETYLALWKMSQQPAWQSRGIKDILAYVKKVVCVQAKRGQAKESMLNQYPREWDHLADDTERPSKSDPHYLALENLEFIQRVSTPRQRQIVDNLLGAPIDGDPFDYVSKKLRLSPDNIRKQIDLLNKKIDI